MVWISRIRATTTGSWQLATGSWQRNDHYYWPIHNTQDGINVRSSATPHSEVDEMHRIYTRICLLTADGTGSRQTDTSNASGQCFCWYGPFLNIYLHQDTVHILRQYGELLGSLIVDNSPESVSSCISNMNIFFSFPRLKYPCTTGQ